MTDTGRGGSGLRQGSAVVDLPARASWRYRVVWSVVSQGLSSVTNFGLLVGLTVLATPTQLGRLVAASSMYLLALTLNRAVVTDPMVAAIGTSGGPNWRWARARTLRLGLATSVIGVGVGVVVDLTPVELGLLMGSIPVLLVQDGQRNLAWARGLPARAAVVDVVWLVVGVVVTGVLAAVTGGISPVVVVAGWVAGGVMSWAVGLVVVEGFATVPVGVAPLPADDLNTEADELPGQSKDADRHDRYRALAVSQAVYVCAYSVLPLVVAIVVSSESAAILKALVLPFTPILSIAAGLRVITLPAMRQAIDDRSATVFQILAGGALCATITAGSLTAVVTRLPDGLVGPSVVTVRPFLAWGGALTVMFVVSQLLADAVALTRSIGIVVRRRCMAIAIEWLPLLVGASIAGVSGLAIGWAVGLALATMLWLAPMAAGGVGHFR